MRNRAARWSAIAPIDPPDGDLVSIALAAAERAQRLPLEAVARRAQRADEGRWVQQWPGEHYRFLAALIEVVQARAVVEVGTYTGLSALTILSVLPPSGRLVSFDVVPWNEVPFTALRSDDFGEAFEQRIGDLSEANTFGRHRELVREADVVFIDGPKDRRFEKAFLCMLLPILRGRGAIVVLDDIRVLEMVDVWEWIPSPKLDVTSFGHWSGTGLVATL